MHDGDDDEDDDDDRKLKTQVAASFLRVGLPHWHR